MPVATVRGVDINYEILGERGPWVALQPGGRRALAGVKSLGEKLAESGCRVLVYDRRNCGASGVSFDGGGSENEIWAEDLRALLSQLDALPAYIGGSSSGCRLALLMALRHPADVHGLLLWRVTGGAMQPSAWSRTTTPSSSMQRSKAAWKRSAAPSISPR